MLRQYATKTFFLFLLATLTSCGTPIAYLPPGTTYGEITVGKPRVSTRERLVNARLEEEAWLNEQLKDTDNKVFGLQGKSDVRSFVGTSASIGVQADSARVGLYREQSSQQLEDLKRERELKSLDYQIALAKKQKELVDATADPTKGTPAFYTTPAKPASTTASPVAPSPPGDQAKQLDELAKSIASLNAQINALTNRADANSKPASADVIVTPIEAFRESLAFRAEVDNKRTANALDDAHDLRGNTLYRLSFDTTVIPGNDTSAWAVIIATVTSGDDSLPTPEEFAAIANDRVDRESADIFGAVLLACVDVKDRKSAAVCIQDLPPSTLALLGRWSGAFSGPSLLKPFLTYSFFKLASSERVSRGFITQTEATRLVARLLTEAGVAADGTVDARSLAAGAANLAQRGLIESLLGSGATQDIRHSEQGCIANSSKRLLGFHDDRGQVAVALDGQRQAVAKITVLNELRNLDIRNRSPVKAAEDRCLEAYAASLVPAVKDALSTESSSVYAYSATPEESVQRISEVLSRREVNQLALALQTVTGAAAVNAFFNYMRANDALYHSLRRQPLVVGFVGVPSDAYFDTVSKGSGSFGWIVGPKYEIRYVGSQQQAGFRHVPMQNSVSAVLSVPSYWKRANIEVRTCWKAEPNVYTQCRIHAGQRILLPGDINRAFDLYKDSQVRRGISLAANRPTVFRVRPGGPASFLIRGDNLWRNTTVLLGGKPADRISMLPDMAGIVAHFDRVEVPAVQRLGAGSRFELAVATSEDFAKVADVVLEGDAKAPAQWAIKGTRAVYPGSSFVIQPDGRLPEAFHSLSVALQNQDKRLDATPLTDIEFLTLSNSVSIKIPASVPNWSNGNRGTLGVLIKRHPGDNDPEGSRLGTLVFYEKETEAHASYRDKAIKDVHTIDLKLPLNYPEAYPVMAGKSAFPVSIVTHLDGAGETSTIGACDVGSSADRRSCKFQFSAPGTIVRMKIGEGEGFPAAREAAK